MNVSSASNLSDSLAIMATTMQSQNFPVELGYAVLKQLQNAQETQAQAIIEMINSITSMTADGTGQIVNRAV